MAEVVPFQGVRYNPELIHEMADVVAPPYDVISPQEQDGFHQRHPNNVIRLILGKKFPSDNEQENVHLRAGRFFEAWRSENILIQDSTPAFYLTTVSFSWQGEQYRRSAIVARVRLEPFDKGIILPHERTFSKVKSERLQLMKCCHANFSPIFSLFSDGEDDLSALYRLADTTTPQVDLVDDKGHRHCLWPITDPHMIHRIASFFQHKIIYIADGHHRYETALNYRDWVKETDPSYSPDHPANFVMMSLSSIEDPGMIVLPAHRLLKQVSDQEYARLMNGITDYFDILSFDMKGGMEAARSEFSDSLAAHSDRKAIGFFSRDKALLQVMILKEGVMARLFGETIPAALRDLDVTVLTQLIMVHVMGFDQARLDDETKISYRTTISDAVAATMEGEADLAFILNPTKIDQVRRVAENGLIMPRKSTYFFPKVISGLVFNLLR